MDCANGAGYKAGPKLLKSLGVNLIVIGNHPNGLNINNKAGSTNPKILKNICPGVFGSIKPVGYCMIGQRWKK